MWHAVFSAMRKFTQGLSFKLSFYAAIIMLIAVLAFSYRSISFQEQCLVDKTVEHALKDSEIIKAAIWKSMMTNDREVIRETLRILGTHGGFKQINIYDAKGTLHYSSRAADAPATADPKASPLLSDLATNPAVRHRVSDDGASVHVVNPLLNDQACSSAACHAHPESEKILGALEVKESLEGIKSTISKSKRETIIFALLLFVLISSISGLAVVFVLIPSIRRLERRAARMARGEYEPTTSVRPADEMGGLMKAFDRMSREINERTAQLANSRKMYKNLFDEAPCYFTVVNQDYRIVRANKAFRNVFGDQVSKNCYVGYKGLTTRCENCPVERTFADGRSHQSEEVWDLAGKKIYIAVKTSPIFDDDGNFTEVLEMSVDVTRLKELQFELEKKRQEYQYLFENVPCYLTVVDRDFRVVQANKEFQRDFGADLGKNCFRLYKGLEFKCEDCPVQETFADGMNHAAEEIWHRNGEEIDIVVNTAPITDDKGEITGVMEMCTNITEIKRLQGELVVLGETIAGMSHNVKNILNGLVGGVYVVDSGLAKGRQDRVTSGWQMVKNNVEKISDLVKGILYASKEREPEYRECDPGQLLAEVCDLFEEKARAGGIRLVREFDPELGSCLLDPARIHNALTNLISNAIEACLTADKSQSRGSLVSVGGRVEGRHLIIEVTDNADGIPAEVKKKLFNKFYSTKGSRGTGLGLVITRKVVEEHRGKISVESEPGRGTRFIIGLPVRVPRASDTLKMAV
jgi:histidine kinase